MSNTLQITLVKSLIGVPRQQKNIVVGLGLKKLNQSVVRPDTPEIRGMINKISHMLHIA
jgi:large subunit ribosomal protein L30